MLLLISPSLAALFAGRPFLIKMDLPDPNRLYHEMNIFMKAYRVIVLNIGTFYTGTDGFYNFLFPC
jgi:hypothetical protein